MKKIGVIVFSLMLFILMNFSPAHAAGNNFSNIYDVRSGDTLWRIAVKYDTSIADLKATNGLQSDLSFSDRRLPPQGTGRAKPSE
jgi:LysM repeat protein